MHRPHGAEHKRSLTIDTATLPAHNAEDAECFTPTLASSAPDPDSITRFTDGGDPGEFPAMEKHLDIEEGFAREYLSGECLRCATRPPAPPCRPLLARRFVICPYCPRRTTRGPREGCVDLWRRCGGCRLEPAAQLTTLLPPVPQALTACTNLDVLPRAADGEGQVPVRAVCFARLVGGAR